MQNLVRTAQVISARRQSRTQAELAKTLPDLPGTFYPAYYLDYGYTSFDNFYMAFLTSFRLVALDAWNRLYYLTLHTSGKGHWSLLH